MDKKIITKNMLIEEMKFYKQLPCYVIFCLSGILSFLVCLTDIKDIRSLLMVIIFVGLPFLIPFGYFLGIKKIKEVLKNLKKVKQSELYIVEKKCIDKQIVNNKDSTNDTQLIFGETSGVWVGRKKSKEFKIGDMCYLVYLNGDEKPSAVFNAKKYELSDELKVLISGRN